MTIESGSAARQLCAAGEEALAEAAFRTGEFSDSESLFGQALALAGRAGDRQAEALAVGGLGMARHYANIAMLVDGLVPDDADVAAEEELMRRALRERLGDPRRVPSALAALGEAELAAGNPRRAPWNCSAGR